MTVEDRLRKLRENNIVDRSPEHRPERKNEKKHECCHSNGSRLFRYLPASTKPTKTPTKPSKGIEGFRVAVVPDTHVPRQEKKTWATALALVRDYNPHAVVIIGDFADCEALSHHPKNRPDLVKFASEMYETNIALDCLQDAAPGAKFYYVEGNHEYRAVKYVNAFPHLDGLLSVPENLFILAPGTHKPTPNSTLHRSRNPRLHVDLRGMEWIPFRKYLRRAWVSPWGCGYMHSAKGNGAWSGGGVNHASYHANNVGPVSGCKLIVYGHHHSFQHFRNPAGYEAYCCGFLGDFDADEPAFDYAGGPSPWQPGIVFQEFLGELSTTFNVPIVNGRAIFRGSLYR